MANTYTDISATANQTSFSYSFPVLLESHVAVSINGVSKTYNTDFIVDKATSVVTLQLGGIVGAGAQAGDIVRVRRRSDPSTDLVDFADGSRLAASRLDLAYQHNRYLNEEASEVSDGAIGEQTVGGVTFLNGANREIRNLATPTTVSSAATKQYVDDLQTLTQTNDATTLASAQAHADSGDATLQANITSGDSATLASAQSHANTGDASTLSSANAYTDARTALTTTNLSAFAQDDYTGDGTTTAFTFVNITPQVTDSKAFLVNIDGITQNPSNYTVSLTGITFSTAPVNSSVITVVTLAGAASLNFPATTSGGNVTFSGAVTASSFTGNLTGNANTANYATTAGSTAGNAQTADALSTPRTISLTGDATGSVSFDGSSNVNIATTVATNISAAEYNIAAAGTTATGTMNLTEASDADNIASVSNGVVTVTAGTYMIFFSGEYQEDDNDSNDYYWVRYRLNGVNQSELKINETGTDYQTFAINKVHSDSSSFTVEVHITRHSGSTLAHKNVSIILLKLN